MSSSPAWPVQGSQSPRRTARPRSQVESLRQRFRCPITGECSCGRRAFPQPFATPCRTRVLPTRGEAAHSQNRAGAAIPRTHDVRAGWLDDSGATGVRPRQPRAPNRAGAAMWPVESTGCRNGALGAAMPPSTPFQCAGQRCRSGRRGNVAARRKCLVCLSMREQVSSPAPGRPARVEPVKSRSPVRPQ